MLSSLLIVLREGLEAALIVGIVLAYLARTGNRAAFKYVWLGVGAAGLVSLGAGAAIYATAGELTGRAEEVFEGSALLVATGVLTWMIFWMRRQAADIRGNLQQQVQAALAGGSWLGMALLAFISVVREGIETVLFLFAATRTAESPAAFAAGGFLGLAGAVVIGYGIYKGTARLNLRMFFNVTSVLLIVFAAGLLAHGVHEFIEVGVVPPLIESVWNTNGIVAGSSNAGHFLTAIFGYNASPSLIEVGVYVVYLAAALGAYFVPSRRRRLAAA